MNWEGKGHRTPINAVLGSLCHFYYPGMVVIDGVEMVADTWDHWGFKEYGGHGTFKSVVRDNF